MITRTQVKRELDISGTTYDALLDFLIESVESVWDQLTNKIWNTGLRLEVLNGSGSNLLFLKHTPITDISYIAVGAVDVLSVQNTSDYAVAFVTVDSSKMYLKLNGSTTSLVLSTHSTMSALASAINALGNGWISEASPTHGGWASSLLIPVTGKSCTKTKLNLAMPDDYLQDFELNSDTGVVVAYSLVPGISNIRVCYTSGYTEDSAPNWLLQSLIRQVGHWYLQATEKRWHVSSITLGEGGTLSYNQGGKFNEVNLLPDFINMSNMHRRINV